MSDQKVFIIGPGFIGRNVVDLLLLEKKYTITGFVRREEQAKILESSGVGAVLGDLGDKDKITAQVLEHDVVFHTATADDLPSVEAVLEGIKQRANKGQSTIYIHTSGTSLLDDGAKGGAKSDKVYRDTKPDEIDALDDEAPHRPVDLAIVKAREELGDKAKIAIMIPPLIYGFNPDHKRLTIQMPTLTRFALKHGFAGYVGTGQPVESNIHVVDLAKAYVVLLHHLESSSSSSKDLLANPYYFCECTGDNEPSWLEVATVIGEGLYKAGKISDPKPRQIPEDLFSDIFGTHGTYVAIGLNSRSRADRLRELGWAPEEKDWKKSYIEDELPEILREDVSGFQGYGGSVAGSK